MANRLSAPNGRGADLLRLNGNTVTATQGPASGTTSTNIGTAAGGDESSQSLQSTDAGNTYQSGSATQGTVPCFAPGTLIATPDGLRAVETLAAGDLVDTLNHGPLPVLWHCRVQQPLDAADRDARPVLIRAGALGAGRPRRDMIVSPQHRMLVGEGGQLSHAFARPGLVPAKALTGLPGIRWMMGKRRITRVHFALPRHAVIEADGGLTESLLLGPVVLAGMKAAQRAEVRHLFASAPGAQVLNGPPARPCLSVGAALGALATARTPGDIAQVA